ncbi:Uncharacterised protein [Vibrio cholerae]|nr:Uncharacterised protein [Vibrio cholerae]
MLFAHSYQLSLRSIVPRTTALYGLTVTNWVEPSLNSTEKRLAKSG